MHANIIHQQLHIIIKMHKLIHKLIPAYAHILSHNQEYDNMWN